MVIATTQLTPAQVSIRSPCNASSSSSLVPNPKPSSNSDGKKPCPVIRCASSSSSSSSFALSGTRTSRRFISIAVLLSTCFFIPKHAIADSGIDKYVKRKKLDPLEVYVPAVILTKSQIIDLGKTLEGDQLQYASFRSLLRSGPAASLRVNIRAVAQYASEDGKGDSASSDVDQCLRALEDLDSLFLRASRNDRGASVASMKAKIGIALVALDRILDTVPSPVLDKAKAIADAYMVADEDAEPAKTLDPELQKLEALL